MTDSIAREFKRKARCCFVLCRNYTIMTRFKLPDELKDYLEEYVIYQNMVYRFMWRVMTSSDYKTRFPTDSKFRTYVCEQYNLLSSTVNSLLREITGRMNALKALKKTEL